VFAAAAERFKSYDQTAVNTPRLKEQGKSRGKAMQWGAMRAEVEGVLCFAWQDNNTVLGITTAYSPDDLVIRTRKRPAQTSTNAAIVRPVFGDEYISLSMLTTITWEGWI
jgi:hypothetical protein